MQMFADIDVLESKSTLHDTRAIKLRRVTKGGWRGSSARLGAQATRLRRNVATLGEPLMTLCPIGLARESNPNLSLPPTPPDRLGTTRKHH